MAFEIDLAHCPSCGGELKIIAAILEQPVIEKILMHLGLQAEARVPPRGSFASVLLRTEATAPDRAGKPAPSPLMCMFCPVIGTRSAAVDHQDTDQSLD